MCTFLRWYAELVHIVVNDSLDIDDVASGWVRTESSSESGIVSFRDMAEDDVLWLCCNKSEVFAMLDSRLFNVNSGLVEDNAVDFIGGLE